jgi:maltose O-acetyltransferase
MRAAGIAVSQVGIESGTVFRNLNLSIGAGGYINRGVQIEGSGRVSLGEKVAIGPGVLILTSTHAVGPSEWRAGEGLTETRAVTIGAGSWIGARATILPGVSIGKGCVVAAGSVVTRDFGPDLLIAGIPAVEKRSLGRSD